MSPRTQPTSPEVEQVAQALDNYKAYDIVVMDVRNLSDATDYFIIASGSSDIHVKSVCNRLIDTMGEAGVHPHHVEGLTRGQWGLIDFVDFVVHVFHPSVRDFYQLERLWADAPRVAISTT